MATKSISPIRKKPSPDPKKDHDSIIGSTQPPPSSSDNRDSLYEDMSIPIEKRERLKAERAMASGK